MTYTVVGLFDNRAQAQTATQELTQKGFIRENIDVSNRRISDSDTAPTQITITEGGISDQIGNFFNSLFDDKKTAGNYTRAAGDADAIISIQVDSAERAREAVKILDRHGAIDVDAHSSKYNQQNFADTSQTTGTLQNTANFQGETAIPIIEEQLQVGKREIEREGARIRSRIIEKPVETSMRLREEHVVINRRPVNREVTDADLASFREGEIVLTEHAEIPVVEKHARVVEEIVIGKQVEEHEQVVRDTVRRTDVEVEEINTNATSAAETNADVDSTDDFSTRRVAN